MILFIDLLITSQQSIEIEQFFLWSVLAWWFFPQNSSICMDFEVVVSRFEEFSNSSKSVSRIPVCEDGQRSIYICIVNLTLVHSVFCSTPSYNAKWKLNFGVAQALNWTEWTMDNAKSFLTHYISYSTFYL